MKKIIAPGNNTSSDQRHVGGALQFVPGLCVCLQTGCENMNRIVFGNN